MWNQIKRVFQLLGGLFLAAVALSSAYIFLVVDSVDLETAAKYQGTIASKGRAGQYFSFRLAEHPYAFIVYEMSRDYTALDADLRVGEQVTVYCPAEAPGENRKVYQAESGGRIIVKKEQLANQHTVGGVIALVGGIVILGGSIHHFCKNRPASGA